MTAYESPFDLAGWQAVVDLLPAVVFSARPDGTVDFVNRRWTEVSGYPPSAFLGNGWRSLIHPDDASRVTGEAAQALRAGTALAFECRFQRPDGSYAWVATRAAPSHGAGGTIERWYGTAVDIDTRKRVEQALRASRAALADSERRFRALAEAIPVICFTADENGWIDWFNGRWTEFTGQPSGEALGWGWQSAHHPDDFLEVMRRWPHSIATGERFEMEYRLRRHDGEFFWFLCRIEPLRNARGRILRWYGSSVEIDAQKRSLERTKRVAETLQEIFLPGRLPHKPNVRFDAVYLPAEQDALVGGDWYDAFELPDGRLVFSIGDVAGHGLDASMSVGRLRQAIFALSFTLRDPAEILRRLNEILEHQEPGALVTALIGTIDPEQQTLRYASAGHPPPLVAYRNDEPAQSQPAGGPPLGLGFGVSWSTQTVPILPDAIVAVYTDGMIEFSRDVLAAEQRLRAAVSLFVGDTTAARPARDIQRFVLDGKCARDDAALLLIQFSAVDTTALRADAGSLGRAWRFHSSDAYTAHTSRREIVTYLRSLAADPSALFACELIMGEVLSNTVEHAPGLVEVHLDWSDEKPVVTVRDTGPGLRHFAGRLPDDPMSEGGRGIYLITALADDVMVRPAPGYGTHMRLVLPISRRPDATPHPS